MSNAYLYKGELASPFVPPRRLNVTVSEVVTITPEHSPPPLPLIRSHRTDKHLYTSQKLTFSCAYHSLMALEMLQFFCYNS